MTTLTPDEARSVRHVDEILDTKRLVSPSGLSRTRYKIYRMVLWTITRDREPTFTEKMMIEYHTDRLMFELGMWADRLPDISTRENSPNGAPR